MFAAIQKLMNKPKPKICHIKDETGKVLTKTNEILNRGRRYCKTFMQLIIKHVQNDQMKKIACCQEPMIMVSEVEKAIRKLKNDKSQGYENIPAEVFKKTAVNTVQMIYNAMWKSQHWPVEWKRSMIYHYTKW